MPPWKKSRLRMPAAIFIISVRQAPTRPKRPVTWPAKTDMVAPHTARPIETFSSESTFLPGGLTWARREPRP